MITVEQVFAEDMKNTTFHNVVNDSFDFLDSLIEEVDVERVEG